MSAFTSEKSTEIEAMKKQSETMRACLSTEEGQRRKLEEQLQKANGQCSVGKACGKLVFEKVYNTFYQLISMLVSCRQYKERQRLFYS